MFTHSYGFVFNRFRGSPIVEPGRRSSGADLDHRVVRGDNGRFSNRLWLSLAQLADTGNPLSSGKTSSVLPSEESGVFCVSCKRAPSGFANFSATKPNGGGLIEEKCGLERLIGRLPYGAGI